MPFIGNAIAIGRRRAGVNWASYWESTEGDAMKDKMAGWWVDGVDQLELYSREELSQNSISGQVFPGRAINYDGVNNYSFVNDNGALDIGTPPFSISFWFKKSNVNVGNAVMLGKEVATSPTPGCYLFQVSYGAVTFLVRSSIGFKTISYNILADTWYHVVGIISDDGTIKLYVNKTATTPVAYTGVFPPVDSVYKFYVGAKNSYLTGNPNTKMECTIRDIRIFKGKELSVDEISSLYIGSYVNGFTEWYMFSDNGNIVHSAKNNGLHLTSVGMSSEHYKNGIYHQPYNDFGYAENNMYGQIPPDMTSLDTEGIPMTDCRGDNLVFKGNSKYNIEKTGANRRLNYTCKNRRTIYYRNAADVISLNSWFSGDIAQDIDIDTIAVYCAGRQFYNKSRDELILIKETSYLTSEEENVLLNYLQIDTIHDYSAETIALFARFEGIYSNIEKSRIDNARRLLENYGIIAKLDVLYLTTISNEIDKNLNWAGVNHNLLPVQDSGYIPNIGMYSQDGGYFNTQFIPSSDGINYTQNDASVSIKVFKNTNTAGDVTLNLAGSIGGNLGRTILSCGISGNRLRTSCYLNSVHALEEITEDFSLTRVYCRSSSSIVSSYNRNGFLNTRTNSTSSIPPDNSIYLTLNSSNSGNTYLPWINYFQHFSAGANLGETNSKLYSRIIDWFCNASAEYGNEIQEENDYRYYLNEKHIIGNNGNICIYTDYSYLYYSTDLGQTYVRRMPYLIATLGMPDMMHIFDNGNIVWTTKNNKCYKSTDLLLSYSEIIPLKSDGTPYPIHTPVNAAYPGNYFRELGAHVKMYIGTIEVFVWGAYTNSLSGASPVNLWITDGNVIKSLYEFGQNPYKRDNGTNVGGTTGTLLGDATNPIYCTHLHPCTQDIDNPTNIYWSTGDYDRAGPVYECHWGKTVIDIQTLTGVTTILKSASRSTRWKSGVANIIDGYIFWASDADLNPLESEIGVFKCLVEDIADGSKHTKIYMQQDITTPFSNAYQFKNRMVGYYASGGSTLFGALKLITSTDMVNFDEIKTRVPGEIYPYKVSRVTDNKWLLNIMVDYDFPLKSFTLIFEWK